MSDLISRKNAIKAIEDLPNAYNGWSDAYDKACIIGVLEEVPTIKPPTGYRLLPDADGWEYAGLPEDVVRVVRCKDCEFSSEDIYADGNVPCWICKHWDWGIEADDYCSYGERRTE